jgi:hypothetical protein
MRLSNISQQLLTVSFLDAFKSVTHMTIARQRLKHIPEVTL